MGEFEARLIFEAEAEKTVETDMGDPVPEAKLGMEVWLAVHPQLVSVPRIAATMDALKPGLKRFSQNRVS